MHPGDFVDSLTGAFFRSGFLVTIQVLLGEPFFGVGKR